VEGIEQRRANATLLMDYVVGLARDASMTMHPAVTTVPTTSPASARIFPFLAMQVYGKPLVYLDNAASAQKPKAVLDRLHQAYTAEYANVHRGLHYLANAATEAYEDAREKVRPSSTRRAKRRSSSPAMHRGDQPRCLDCLARAHQAGVTRSCSLSMEHHSNIVPCTSCVRRQAR